MPELIVFIVGLIAVIRGADWLGRSSIRWAQGLGIPHIVVGATLVSVATTLPELSIAAVSGSVNKGGQLALGAVWGSPLVNLGIILGILFLFSKNRPDLGYYSRSLNIFLLVASLLLTLSLYRPFGGAVALFLIILGFLFLALEFLITKRSINTVEKVMPRLERFRYLLNLATNRSLLTEFLLGTLLLVLGSKYVVDSTIALSNLFNVNELFISVTLLAIASSLPELMTTINSIIYKREGVAVGNLVGASVIDITFGTGLATLFNTTLVAYPTNLFILGPMLAIGVLCLLVLWKRVPLKFVGGLLIATSLLSLGLFASQELF